MQHKVLEPALAMLGTIVLFASWIIQQFLFSAWKTRLGELASIDAVVHSYKAADSVIRAVAIAGHPVVRNDGDTIESRLDTNFNRAAAYVFKSLDRTVYEQQLARFPNPPDNGEYPTYNTRLHYQFDALHRTIRIERDGLESKKTVSEYSFLVLYIAGTLLIIASFASKLLDARQSDRR